MHSAGVYNAGSQTRNDSFSRTSSVTTATPAKRITFYKSGDNQFSGIRMPIQKRSFKCFDALLDDLSQKIPLPFGVRTITTPRGTNAIQSLEQLQDGACYLCSDRHCVKPVDMEIAGKQAAVWHYPLNTPRKPSRPDKLPTGHSGHHYRRRLKRIVLVKNSDPALRRSIVLSRTMSQSLHVFMEEISELMEYNVRKLYTPEGRKIDSMRSLMQCPSVLVCVGREPFNPLLELRKNSEEKLPGIGVKSPSSFYSDAHDSKKNVNFGLETKKSIIHPRSDSSNKSTKFSVSSDKSYPNGSDTTPGQLGRVTREVVMNDDGVEKRVLVNKDGSLSVEMKVRFHLVSDETLQWSTRIKKLPTSTDACNSLQKEEPHYLQHKAVFAEPENPSDTGETCSPNHHQMDFVECYCQNSCSHIQGYDIWKNPLHKDDGTCRTISSLNSAGSTDKFTHQKSSVYTVSRSSEDYTEHVVETASCFQQTIEEMHTRSECCSLCRCCSRSELSSSAAKCNEPDDACEINNEIMCHYNDGQKANYAEVKVARLSDNVISATSNSDDYNGMSPSDSGGSHWCSEHCYGCQRSQHLQSFSRLAKDCSALQGKLYKAMYAAPAVSTDSTDCPRSSRSHCCSQCNDVTTGLVESEIKSGAEADDGKMSNNTGPLESENRCKNTMSTSTCFPFTVCPCCGGCGRLASTKSAKTNNPSVQGAEEEIQVEPLGPEKSNQVTPYEQQQGPAGEAVQNMSEVRHGCFQSDPSSRSVDSGKSYKSEQRAYGIPCDAEIITGDGFGECARSVKSIGSEKTNNDLLAKLTTSRLEFCPGTAAQENIPETESVVQGVDLHTKERLPSAMATKTHSSNDSDKPNKCKSNNIPDTVTASPPVSPSFITEKTLLEKSAEASVKSNACSDGEEELGLNTRQTSYASPSPKSPITVENERPLSVKSMNSSKSSRSNKCHCSSGRRVQKITKNPLGICKSPASHGKPLSPTSTASVSLKLGAEKQSEDLNQQSMSGISQTFNKCTTSTCSTVPPCKGSEVTSSGALTGCMISTEMKKGSTVEVQLLQHDDDDNDAHSVISTLSGSLKETQKNSARKRIISSMETSTKTDNNGETNKALSISGSSFKSIRNKIKSKTTSSGSGISPDQNTIKSKGHLYSNSTASAISLKVSKSNKEVSPRNKHKQICITPDSNNGVLPYPPDLLQEKDTDTNSVGRRTSLNTPDKKCVLKEKRCNDEELVPTCLPNASPTDVVNDWLKKLPIDGPMYETEDELSEQGDKTLLHIPAVNEAVGDRSEPVTETIESGPEVAGPVTEDEYTTCQAKPPPNEMSQTIAANSDVSSKSTERENRTINCQPSIQVMKVLLSPKLDRCNSLPEVSPTYGRKLSTSVKGLLDCLGSLEIIDPDPKIYDKYTEIISTFQSLWNNRFSETVQDKPNKRNHPAKDEINIRSSSGICLSSDSIGSGKASIIGGVGNSEVAPGRVLMAEENVLSQDQEDAIMRGECESLSVTPDSMNPLLVFSEPITPDIAERVRCSPDHEKLNQDATNDDFHIYNHLKATEVVDLTFSEGASENNESDSLANDNPRTSAPDHRGKLAKRISQDPDPVWVLSLLKKLENQFMSHYANAIAEFKLRWDLNDNETLDIMISELKDEVHKRIQSTINRELQKIQSRAGRTPRPPMSTLSRDSTVQTEQRRRRLKGMQNRCINPSGSDAVNTASGSEFSDQCSDDEYCPCDTCVKKKMASRVVQCAEALRAAPVFREFDLRKILQTKKDPLVTIKPVPPNLLEGAESSIIKAKEGKKETAITEEINDGGQRTVKEGSPEEPEESNTRGEMGEDLEDRRTENRDVIDRTDNEAEDATHAIEEGEGNSVVEKELNVEGAEEVSEQEATKESETEMAEKEEEEEVDEMEEKAETPEEGE